MAKTGFSKPGLDRTQVVRAAHVERGSPAGAVALLRRGGTRPARPTADCARSEWRGPRFGPCCGIWEIIMRFTGTGVMLLVAGVFAGSAAAQPAQAPAPVTRTIVAATKLQSVVETPLYFRALQLSLPPREASTLSAANGILYQLSGSTEISLDNETKTLHAGEGMVLAAG
jgi:hypothetical protein